MKEKKNSIRTWGQHFYVSKNIKLPIHNQDQRKAVGLGGVVITFKGRVRNMSRASALCFIAEGPER